METNPSLAAAGRSDFQEFRSLLRSLKFNYHIHKSLLLVPNLSQMNSTHNTQSYFSKIRLNIILQLTSRSSQLYFFF
jgi:hypothetical protein